MSTFNLSDYPTFTKDNVTCLQGNAVRIEYDAQGKPYCFCAPVYRGTACQLRMAYSFEILVALVVTEVVPSSTSPPSGPSPQISCFFFVYWAIAKIIQVRVEMKQVASINVCIISLSALILSHLANLAGSLVPRREFVYAMRITPFYSAVLTGMYVLGQATNWLAGGLVLVYWSLTLRLAFRRHVSRAALPVIHIISFLYLLIAAACLILSTQGVGLGLIIFTVINGVFLIVMIVISFDVSCYRLDHLKDLSLLRRKIRWVRPFFWALTASWGLAFVVPLLSGFPAPYGFVVVVAAIVLNQTKSVLVLLMLDRKGGPHRLTRRLCCGVAMPTDPLTQLEHDSINMVSDDTQAATTDDVNSVIVDDLAEEGEMMRAERGHGMRKGGSEYEQNTSSQDNTSE